MLSFGVKIVESDVVTTVECNSVVMLLELMLVCVVGREMRSIWTLAHALTSSCLTTLNFSVLT